MLSHHSLQGKIYPASQAKQRTSSPLAAGMRSFASLRMTETLKRLHCLQHLVDMAGHFHLVPDLGDGASLVDQEGGALDAHVLAAIEALLDPGSVLLADLAVLVGHQREVELVFLLELVVFLHAVLGDADHLGLDLG